MKKILTVIVVFFAITTAKAQENRNVIKINPLSLFLGNISLSYERIVSEKVGLQLQAGYWLGGKVNDTKWGGVSLTPEARFYLTSQERPKGFYVAPFARYQQLKTTDTNSDYTVKITRIGGGVSAGYQFLFGKKVTWDIFVGPQYLNNTVKDSNGSTSTVDYDRFTTNFGVRFGTTFGFAF